jgi:hypothetical protein
VEPPPPAAHRTVVRSTSRPESYAAGNRKSSSAAPRARGRAPPDLGFRQADQTELRQAVARAALDGDQRRIEAGETAGEDDGERHVVAPCVCAPSGRADSASRGPARASVPLYSSSRRTVGPSPQGVGSGVLLRRECPYLARKRPTVAPAEGLLTEAVLKHACVVPSGRR